LTITRRIPRRNTTVALRYALDRFREHFGERPPRVITAEEILSFLNPLTEGRRSSTRTLRYFQLNSFFNFCKHSFDPGPANPCDTPILREAFRRKTLEPWTVLGKEIAAERCDWPDNA